MRLPSPLRIEVVLNGMLSGTLNRSLTAWSRPHTVMHHKTTKLSRSSCVPQDHRVRLRLFMGAPFFFVGG